MPSETRQRVDRCPGALRVHPAADGGLARVRLPGGLASAGQLRALADAASEFGDGRLELTSRANVQLRALSEPDVPALATRLADAGLLPSATHERVRNIMASPLAGIDRPIELTGLAARLDAELCARPGLAELPGRFLFGLDDGRGDIAALGPDITVVVDSGRANVAGFELPLADAVGAALTLAEAFLLERSAQGSRAWRIAELDGGLVAVAARAGLGAPRTASVPAPPVRPVGRIAQVDGGTALVVLAPLGRLSARQTSTITELAGERGVRVTPWRSVVLPDVADPDRVAEALAAVGLGVDAASPWYRVSACTGRPGCASALADVQADARAQAARWPNRQVHVSGCARHCGRPTDTEVDVTATSEGYLISE
jgi:precorrin-3B synthase